MSLNKSTLCKELKVKKKIHETSDSVSLILSIPEEHKSSFSYKAGQFVTFFLTIDGEEIRRSYSLASSPQTDSEFKVTVKRVHGGKGSNYLIDQVREGQTLFTTPPAGRFVLPRELHAPHIVFFAAGSGITPIISLIKSTLHLYPNVKCSLLFQNRHEDSIIFKQELEELSRSNPKRFILQHILSEAKGAGTHLVGRIDKNLIRDFLAQNLVDIHSLNFICGPEGFMKVVERSLTDLGVDSAHIIKESFSSPLELESASPSEESPSMDANIHGTLIGDPTTQAKPEEIEAVFDSKTVRISCRPERTILESLLEAGHNPPYSCMDGACMACLAKVDSGLVYQENLGILTDDNVEAKECLTCQARPLSKKVRVNFDSY